jgi:hypothetical protein
MAGNAPHIPGCRDLALIGERVARSLFAATGDDGRAVTVTVFPPLGDGRTRDGFDRAAATAQRLGAHPSVVTIHRWGHADDGRPWIVTAPQPAESVDTLLTMDGPLEVDRSLQVGVLLAGALETAHRAGIVHGDLSPARLVFGPQGEPLLAETGLAEYAVFPGLGALNNPVRYHAPPEVLERTEITPATDVYSLATTVYALLAGRAPQQKPAEITDSNASLLLRILQMPVPAIERPGLAPGLEDALRGPLSASPSERPQQAIEVAWLLQDVQRRAGFPVTEPIVLDLDDLHAAGEGLVHRVAPGTAARPTVDAVLPPPVDGRWADEWRAVPPPAPSGLAPYDDHAPAEPLSDLEPEADPPPPTIFPFAEGAGASAFGDTTPASPARSNGDAVLPWPTPAGADQPMWTTPPAEEVAASTLWPSTWPAGQPQDATPAWAAPPPDAAGPAATDAPPDGGDGGSISDAAAFPAKPDGEAAGRGAPPTFGPVVRPPELDELPAWYTDPLPNGGTAVPPATDDRGVAPPAPGEPPAPPADGPGPTARDPLPGAGDDLRSLFGQVVGEPPGVNGAAGGGGAPRTNGRAAPPPSRAEPDPLGPPQPKPPIDLSRLDAPLGPTPYLDPPVRLPRRHEVQPWLPPATPPGPAPAPARRARSAAPDVAGPAAGDRPAGRPAGGRPLPRQVAPAPGRRATGDGIRAAASAGPPALPLIILIVVVAVLALGVAWLVLTGDDNAESASDRARDTAPSGEEAPTGLQVSQVPEGMELSWSAAADADYVVTILSPEAPPKALPPTQGTSALVPNVELASGTGRCFTVAAAGDDGTPGTPSEPACTPGASIDTMQPG